MGKVIPILPELSESQARRILDNVSNAVCLPEVKAQAIYFEAEYIAYSFQRGLMTASQLDTIGYPHALMHEVRYVEERLEAAAGGSDE